ncbi:unnamed protein product [Sphenostylis stenocarpa]|uniref:Lipoyl-binding domain-containing protein n=1 Tax=Sphenostylis stenocarpa TaxID=92480 RepID=A0AA86V6F0_9FABA|nr:unnamed protein product [Sphenostylis stenocarpa]
MESSAAIRSFHYPMGTMSHMRPSREKQVIVPIQNVRWNSKSKLFIQQLAYDQKHINSRVKGNNKLVSCAKTADAINTSKSDDASSDSTPQGSLEKPLQPATFPNGFEALVLEVCDETEIAELKVKVGDFEMHIKRNIGAIKVPLSNISPTTPPPIPSKPMNESAPDTLPPSPPKSSSEKKNPFVDAFKEKSPRLAALEASGTDTYVFVPSPTVGYFRRGRTVKGKKQPPVCKEGDLVKEGQIVGYLDQFGNGLPVKTDVAGQVLKLLVKDGEPVGYGDPLISILPSFHDIK